MSKTNNVRVVIAHYNEDLSWVNNLKYPFWIISKHSLPLETIPNKGNEVSSYLEYIIKNYHELTDITFFVHGHRTAWHNGPNIDEFINEVDFNLDYFNVNSIHSPRSDMYLAGLNETERAYLDPYKEIIEKEIKIKIHSDKIKFRAAACFYVKKEAILRHDLSVYKNWYAWLMDMKEPSGISSRVFEYCWHIIFTGKHIDNYLNF